MSKKTTITGYTARHVWVREEKYFIQTVGMATLKYEYRKHEMPTICAKNMMYTSFHKRSSKNNTTRSSYLPTLIDRETCRLTFRNHKSKLQNKITFCLYFHPDENE